MCSLSSPTPPLNCATKVQHLLQTRDWPCCLKQQSVDCEEVPNLNSNPGTDDIACLWIAEGTQSWQQKEGDEIRARDESEHALKPTHAHGNLEIAGAYRLNQPSDETAT